MLNTLPLVDSAEVLGFCFFPNNFRNMKCGYVPKSFEYLNEKKKSFVKQGSYILLYITLMYDA